MPVKPHSTRLAVVLASSRGQRRSNLEDQTTCQERRAKQHDQQVRITRRFAARLWQKHGRRVDAGYCVMRIGTQGGRVKPSTGYAFLRIQRDSAAIVESLQRRGHPFDVPKDSGWYRLHDSIMLDVMAQQGGQAHSLFTALFRRNPVRRIFRFLDEAGSMLNDVALLASLPPWPFLRALLRVYARRWRGLDSFTHP